MDSSDDNVLPPTHRNIDGEQADRVASKSGSQVRLFRSLPLDPAQPVIRVIEIIPNNLNQPLQCSMSVIGLNEPYVALSYVWGQEDAEEQVMVEGESLTVRQNLLLFLKTTRNKITSGTLQLGPIFIDALCIDQISITERNHQVRQMGQVYRNARRVYSWLGSGLPHLENIFTALADVAQYRHRTRWPPKIMQERWAELISEDGKELKEIGDLDYWQRLWIVPEVCLAKDLVILSGSQQVAAIELFELFVNIKRYAPPYISSSTDFNDGGAPPRLQLACKRWAPIIDATALNDFLVLSDNDNYLVSVRFPILKDQKFAELVHAYGHKQCLDCRDRLFALLAIARDRNGQLIDYNESPLSLFLKVATVEEEEPFRHLKLLAEMFRLLSTSSETRAFDKAEMFKFEIDFRGYSALHESWHDRAPRADHALHPRTVPLANQFKAYRPAGVTESDFLVCHPESINRFEIVILPTEHGREFETVGVISGGDLTAVKWLSHNCTLAPISQKGLQCQEAFQTFRHYRLIPPSLAALLELLEAIDLKPPRVTDIDYLYPDDSL